jgi:hypothetical protein
MIFTLLGYPFLTVKNLLQMLYQFNLKINQYQIECFASGFIILQKERVFSFGGLALTFNFSG